MTDSYFKNEIKRINKICNINNIIYKDGPLKTSQRSLIKILSDYNNEIYPTSAHLLDVNRCLIITKNSFDLLKYYNFLSKNINFDIIRIKNGFIDFNEKNLKYCDIKMNLLINHKKYGSIITELQIIISWMANYKINVSHPFYTK